MGGKEVTRETLQRAGLFATNLARRLSLDPVGLVDVGARWGISEKFVAAAPLFSAIAFEPDPDEAKRIVEKGRSEDWASFAVEATALGRDSRSYDLNIYSRANNSSIYKVSEDAKRRYSLGGFELEKIFSVPTKPIDAVIFGAEASARAGEVVKLDTQGAELEILFGGPRTFNERTICLIAEVHFFALYDGAPFFSDIDQHLRKLNFTFMGFADFQNRSSKRLDKRSHWGRERVFQADAVYFREPVVAAELENPRIFDVAILMAVLLGYFDLALEWAAGQEGVGIHSSDVAEVINRVSIIGQNERIEELEALLASARQNPELAHVLAGKFVDRHRDFATFHDISNSEPLGHRMEPGKAP